MNLFGEGASTNSHVWKGFLNCRAKQTIPHQLSGDHQGWKRDDEKEETPTLLQTNTWCANAVEEW